MKEIVVDVRELPAPEPLERVLEALETLASGDTIKMIHRHRPCSLFDILEERGCKYEIKDFEDYVEIKIWRVTK